MKSLHSCNIIHGDIALRNIVISDDRLTITIIDFGMSSECHTAEIFIKEEEQLIQLLRIEN